MPSPATRARKALLAVLAAMAILTGLIPAALIHDRGLPAAATATHRRPDDDGDDDTDDDSDDSDDADSDSGDSDSDDDTDSDSDDDDVDEEKLPDNVKAILKKERKARRDAERKLRQATRKPAAKPKPKSKPSSNDGDDDDTDDSGLAAFTAKLRRSNFRAALAEHGVAADRVKAAVRLIDLDDVEFDDDDEPTNLDDVLEGAFDTYPFLKADAKPKPKAPDIDSGDKPSKKTPKLTAEQLEAAKTAGMTPEKYAALLHGGSLEDWQNLQKDAKKKK